MKKIATLLGLVALIFSVGACEKSEKAANAGSNALVQELNPEVWKQREQSMALDDLQVPIQEAWAEISSYQNVNIFFLRDPLSTAEKFKAKAQGMFFVLATRNNQPYAQVTLSSDQFGQILKARQGLQSFGLGLINFRKGADSWDYNQNESTKAQQYLRHFQFAADSLIKVDIAAQIPHNSTTAWLRYLGEIPIIYTYAPAE